LILAICQSSLIGLWLRIRHLDGCRPSALPGPSCRVTGIAGHVGDVLGLDARGGAVLAFDRFVHFFAVDRDGLGSIDTSRTLSPRMSTTVISMSSPIMIVWSRCLDSTNILAPSLAMPMLRLQFPA